MLENLFKNNSYYSAAASDINKQTNKNVDDTLSRFATTGLSRSGIQGAALDDIYAGGSDAITNAAGQETMNKLGILNSLISVQNSQEQLDNQPSGWGQVLGNLFSGAAQVGSAALLASDKKLKKNIKKVGETKSDIPLVTFNYKDGGKVNHLGMLSKDVKKKFPKAVMEVIDYSKVPEAEFQELN